MNKLADYFTNKNPRKVTVLKARAPQWLKDAVEEAHQGTMPSDWVYDECRGACEAIDDGSLVSTDDVHAHADGREEVPWPADEEETP